MARDLITTVCIPFCHSTLQPIKRDDPNSTSAMPIPGHKPSVSVARRRERAMSATTFIRGVCPILVGAQSFDVRLKSGRRHWAFSHHPSDPGVMAAHSSAMIQAISNSVVRPKFASATVALDRGLGASDPASEWRTTPAKNLYYILSAWMTPASRG